MTRFRSDRGSFCKLRNQISFRCADPNFNTKSLTFCISVQNDQSPKFDRIREFLKNYIFSFVKKENEVYLFLPRTNFAKANELYLFLWLILLTNLFEVDPKKCVSKRKHFSKVVGFSPFLILPPYPHFSVHSVLQSLFSTL